MKMTVVPVTYLSIKRRLINSSRLRNRQEFSKKTRPNGDLCVITLVLRNLASYPAVVVFALITSLIQQCMARGLTWIISMVNSNRKFMCPVCGYPDLDEPPYDSFGCAS
jgi:hypothetical protein